MAQTVMMNLAGSRNDEAYFEVDLGIESVKNVCTELAPTGCGRGLRNK